MRILLPPSETKRLGGRQQFFPEQLFRADQLDATRVRVRGALESVSRDAEAATRALKLGVRNGDERLRNLDLETSPGMPAIDRYTGVLYDALGASELPAEARAWAEEHVFVQSALFGLLRAGDTIPAYRLSASSRLPELAQPLRRAWAPAHVNILDGVDYVLDLRSKDYAALAPAPSLGAAAHDYLEVVARGDDGEVRALNHFNKSAKGALVRHLALAAPSITTRADLVDWAVATGLELKPDAASDTVRLVTEQ